MEVAGTQDKQVDVKRRRDNLYGEVKLGWASCSADGSPYCAQDQAWPAQDQARAQQELQAAKLNNMPKNNMDPCTLPEAKLNNMPKNNTAPCTPPEAFMPPPTELSPFHEWLEVASDRLKERIANGEVFVAGVFNSIWVGFDIHGKPTDIWA